jgi:hypothetical protein
MEVWPDARVHLEGLQAAFERHACTSRARRLSQPDTRDQTGHITSRRGLITECRFETDSCNRSESINLRKVSTRLEGDRFGLLDAASDGLEGEPRQVRETIEWLREAMQS